jgi:hypothetical protein
VEDHVTQVDASGAKDRLGRLRDPVEVGDQVTDLVFPEGSADGEVARAAAQRIREMRNGITLGGVSIKQLIDENRR